MSSTGNLHLGALIIAVIPMIAAAIILSTKRSAHR